uniref:Uncharacterized protein n=1 Tax=Glossina pallidipes TaxID=7398 RepID=A0A1A9Z6Z7_GLOPL
MKISKENLFFKALKFLLNPLTPFEENQPTLTVPSSVPHKTLVDTELMGYKIPKLASVLESVIPRALHDNCKAFKYCISVNWEPCSTIVLQKCCINEAEHFGWTGILTS